MGAGGTVRHNSRRKFLVGATACLGLPWLEAFAPKAARGQALSGGPQRFLPIYFPNGVERMYWPAKGSGRGADWSLSPIQEPLTPLKHKSIIVTNIENYTHASEQPFVYPEHARASGSFMTCVDAYRKSSDANVLTNGVSVDQALEQAWRPTTRFPSLQLGLGTERYSCDGSPCEFSEVMSWKSPTEPLYSTIDPAAVFDLLMGGDGQGAATQQSFALSHSVLDAVLENAERTRLRLGAEDQRRLDQYLTSVREVEQRIEREFVPGGSCFRTARPDPVGFGVINGVDGYSRETHARVMSGLIALAFQCDATRIISYMLDHERSDFKYDHVPLRQFSEQGSTPIEGRFVTHAHGVQEGLDGNNDFATLSRWFVQVLTNLCLLLDSIDEGEGTALDSSVVFFGSGMCGQPESHDRLPLVIVGSGGGRLLTDQHVVLPEAPHERSLRDLYFTFLNSVFGANVPSFGESVYDLPNTVIEEVLA